MLVTNDRIVTDSARASAEVRTERLEAVLVAGGQQDVCIDSVALRRGDYNDDCLWAN